MDVYRQSKINQLFNHKPRIEKAILIKLFAYLLHLTQGKMNKILLAHLHRRQGDINQVLEHLLHHRLEEYPTNLIRALVHIDKAISNNYD